MIYSECLSNQEWDIWLERFNGHPLQSACWGEARRAVDGFESLYLMFGELEHPLGMARVETRKLPLLGNVAWIPRGPTITNGVNFSEVEVTLHRALREYGFALVITDSYTEAHAGSDVRTIWIDLKQGLEALKKRIDKQWMYGVRRAAREGVEVRCASNQEEVRTFFNMCLEISRDKGFELPGSENLMQFLLRHSTTSGQDMHLLLAIHEGKIGAGAFVVRSGQHAHYLWGAADRALSRQRVGEAVQWAAIEWAASHGCTRYDLEGIDPVNNPGVYAFKKKMGGNEVTLVGKKYAPLNNQGRIMYQAAKILGRV